MPKKFLQHKFIEAYIIAVTLWSIIFQICLFGVLFIILTLHQVFLSSLFELQELADLIVIIDLALAAMIALRVVERYIVPLLNKHLLRL